MLANCITRYRLSFRSFLAARAIGNRRNPLATLPLLAASYAASSGLALQCHSFKVVAEAQSKMSLSRSSPPLLSFTAAPTTFGVLQDLSHSRLSIAVLVGACKPVPPRSQLFLLLSRPFSKASAASVGDKACAAGFAVMAACGRRRAAVTQRGGVGRRHHS